jgi:hypothetical protein
VYDEEAMNEGNVQDWYHLFKEGDMLSALNNKLLVGAIFCDLEKAFDCVNHDILLLNQEFYGIIGKANALIKSYLNDRYQRVLVNNKYSNTTFSVWGLVKQGAPQGSILGHLFSFYT